MDIDVEKLAEYLTEQWWENEFLLTIDPRKLYEDQLIEDTGMRLISEIKGEYASIYLRKIQEYLVLIESFEIE